MPSMDLGPWGNTVTALLLGWAVVGVLFLSMPLALVIWLAIGVLAAAVLYFSGVRFHSWGAGQ